MTTLYSILWGKKKIHSGWYQEVNHLKNKYYYIKNERDGFYVVKMIKKKVVKKWNCLQNIFELPVDVMFYCGKKIDLKFNPCCQKCGGPIYIGLNNVECYVCENGRA